ncbi:MAG: leucyl/phenylalanyl-tRNA--protein transferase [Bdellovibrionales bacterium]
MSRSYSFPNIKFADPDGYLCFSKDLNPQMIFEAYSQGIFPWPQDEENILWFSPPERGILEAKDLYINKSLRKVIHKTQYEVKWNQDFSLIIRACRDQFRPGQNGTWISEKMIEAYTEAHRTGFISCLGIYIKGKLTAGIYGVALENYFSLESMFYLEPNHSKIAFVEILSLLSKKYTWVDLQMLTNITEKFGGKIITRSEFLKKIS